MIQSVTAKKRVTLNDVGLFSDGTAVKLVGEETFRVTRGLVDDYMTVDTDAVCAAIKDVFQDTRSIMEPAGAMGVAALKQYVQTHGIQNQTLVAITCGANMNFDRLRFVAERAELGEQREALFAVTIPEKVGAFRHFCQVIGSRSITEFNYRMSNTAEAHVFVGLTIRSSQEADEVAALFEREGYTTVNLTHDELAKEHGRHLVGGRTQHAANERLIRFTFPERPGALLKFLQALHPSWNISLFHYRNQGADYGRVLVGLQIGHDQSARLETLLNTLVDYPWVEETDNPVYRLFLG
jgi:threonine dehydratase